MAPKDKDLEPISDKKIVSRYFQYALDFQEAVSCFVESDQIRFETVIKVFDPPSLKLELRATGPGQKVKFEELKAVGKGQSALRLSFAVNDVLYFAQAEVLEQDSQRLNVTIAMPIYKLQRRDAMRIKILDEHKATITIDGKAYIPHDLSATGLSFVVMKDESDLFPKGRTLDSCTLKFSSLLTTVNLEVMIVSKLKQDNDRLLKVGLRFVGLSPAVEQRLAREAYLYTHKIWSRRI